MTHDDDFADLDRLLAALPLEEPPAGLRARILTATVYRPVAAIRTWELWAIATFGALAAWLVWFTLTMPHAGERLVDLTARLVDAGGLDSLSTVGWLAAGISAAWWISQLSFPGSRRIEGR